MNSDSKPDLQNLAAEVSARLNAGALAQAQALLTPQLQATPQWGLGWKLQAALWATQGRHGQALQAVQTAASLLPEDAELFNIAGTVLRDTGQLHQAIAHYFKAVQLNPNLPEVHNNLGGAFMLKGEVAHAITAFGNALAYKADFPEAHLNMGSALLAQQRLPEATAHFLRADNLQPTHQQALSLACFAMLQSAQWEWLDASIKRMQSNLGQPGFTAPTPFVFNGLPGATRQQQLQCARQFTAEHYAGFLNAPVLCQRRVSASGKLRIGYVSADFHEHATAYLLVGVIEQHDRSQFEVFGYSYGPSNPNPMRTRLTAAFDVLRDIAPLAHAGAAQLIANDNIDILIDLKGFTESGRPPIAALRPAPVVVSWLGYPGTLGLPRMADYLIGDATVTPLAHQADYSETLALMPHCYQPTDANRPVAPTPLRSDAGLPVQGFVFCSFNQIYKITPDVFDLWCRIVAGVPGSVLWLLQGNPLAMANLTREAALRGLAADRLVFAPKLPQAQHLARLALADLALDTAPYTSHTTGSDALWAGVPLITRQGETFGARVAASLLHAVGLPQLVSKDATRYVTEAIALAHNSAQLAACRQHLQTSRATSPLFNTAGFTRHLEALYKTLRAQNLAGMKEAFAVPANHLHW